MTGDSPFADHSLADLCIFMQIAPGAFCIKFPGGTEVCASIGLEHGDPATIARALIAQINTALMPLTPVFNIIDVIKKAIDCIQAVPGIVGPPPDPSGVINCIPGLLQALEKVLGMIPPFSIFPLIKGILQALILFLGGISGELHAMIAQTTRIARAATLAAEPGNFELKSIVSCATGNFDAQMQNLNASIAPLNRLVGVINTICKLAGIEAIPDFADLGTDAEAALAPLDTAVQALQFAASVIPG